MKHDRAIKNEIKKIIYVYIDQYINLPLSDWDSIIHPDTIYQYVSAFLYSTIYLYMYLNKSYKIFD